MEKIEFSQVRRKLCRIRKSNLVGILLCCKETEANGNRPESDCVLLQTRVLFLLSRSNTIEVWF